MSPLSCPRIALFGNFGTIVKAMKEKCSRNRILSALTSKWTILREDKLFIVRLGVKEPSHEIRPLSKTSFVVASLIHQNVKLWTLWNVFPVFQMFRLTEKYHSQETTMLTCSRKTIIVKSRTTLQRANELWTWGGKWITNKLGTMVFFWWKLSTAPRCQLQKNPSSVTKFSEGPKVNYVFAGSRRSVSRCSNRSRYLRKTSKAPSWHQVKDEIVEVED